jgi:hypothetical protein
MFGNDKLENGRMVVVVVYFKLKNLPGGPQKKHEKS